MEQFERDKYIFSEIPGIVDVSDRANNLREKQISLMVKELFLYKVLVKDLVTHEPKPWDRNLILNISFFIISDIDIFERFQKKRELPFNRIVDKTNISRVFLDKWQDYIVAYIIILSNPNYKLIQDYLRIEYMANDNQKITTRDRADTHCKGLLIKDSKRSGIILTNRGEFIKIKRPDNARAGREVQSSKKAGVKHIKLKLALVMFLLVVIALAGYSQYTKVVRTVIIETSSKIKLETNRFDNVVYAYSDTEKGKALISSVNPNDKDIDTVLQESLEYALDNNMIDPGMIFDSSNNSNSKLLVTVTDEPIKFGKLKLTGEYIVSKKINLVINNAGYQQKLYESTIKQEEEEDGEK